MNVTAKLKNNQLELRINDELVRTITPQDKGSYKFKYNNEEYHFVYEEKRIMKRHIRRISLYPINDFKPNNIIDL